MIPLSAKAETPDATGTVASTESNSVEQLVFSEANRRVKIHGLSEQEYVNASLNLDQSLEVNEFASQLVAELHNLGYVAAEAVVISSNEIFVNIGIVSSIHVSGVSGALKNQIESLARMQLGAKININSLDSTLTNINSLSGIDANMALKADGNELMNPNGWTPDRNTSHYTLYINVSHDTKQHGALTIDSAPRKLFQRNRATVSHSINSAFVGGDRISGSFTHIWGDHESDQNEGSVTYFLPLLNNGLYAELYGSYTASKNEVSSNVVADFAGSSYTAVLGYPLVRRHDETLTIVGGLGYQLSDQDGQPVGKVSAGTSTLFYNHSDPHGNSITSGITITGGNAESQTIAKENGGFSHFRIGAGYIHSLSEISDDTELRIEAFGQFTTSTLPSSQKFTLGGDNFLRGYPTGVFSGDEGVNATIEIGHKFFPDNSLFKGLNLKGFYDYGLVKNRQSNSNSSNRPVSKSISSVGIAATIDLERDLSISGWLAAPFDKGNQGETLDPAAYLKISKGW
ncbi:MAG: ShlB/FhaC/HecB family hemolysin secretion/activation protein [Gammaproteobacteria bacterium]